MILAQAGNGSEGQSGANRAMVVGNVWGPWRRAPWLVERFWFRFSWSEEPDSLSKSQLPGPPMSLKPTPLPPPLLGRQC